MSTVSETQDLRRWEPYVLQYRIEQLMREYCECIDEDRLEDWPRFFSEDGRYEITTRSNVERGLPATTLSCQSVGMMRDRVVSLRNANIYGTQLYRHLVTNINVIDVQSDSVRVQSNYVVVRTLAREGEPRVFSVGRSLDTVVWNGTGLRFCSRQVIADNDRIHTLIVLPI